MELTKRDQLISQAFQVFYKNGFHSSGLVLLLGETGISKKTLYSYFDSKEDLIAETINFYTDNSFVAFDRDANKLRGDSPAKILSVFDSLLELDKATQAAGCYAINAKLEYSGKNQKIEEACGRFFDGTEERFFQYCKELGCKSAKATALQISLLYRGAVVSAQHADSKAPINAAKSAVKIILQASLVD